MKPNRLMKFILNNLHNMKANMQQTKKAYCHPTTDVIEIEPMVVMGTSQVNSASNVQTTESTRMKVDSSFDW
jgi:hypothetical protein